MGTLDSQLLEGLYSPIFRSRDLGSLPNFRAYVRSFGRLGQTPFSIDVAPPSADQSPTTAACLREQCRQRFGRDRSVVEEEIANTYRAYNSPNEHATSTSPVDLVVRHMEFLGYKTIRDAKDKSVQATHHEYPNTSLREFGGGILFTTIYRGGDLAKSDAAGFLERINALNEKAVVGRFYADNDMDFFAEAWIPSLYDKVQFGAFIESWNHSLLLMGAEASGLTAYLDGPRIQPRPKPVT